MVDYPRSVTDLGPGYVYSSFPPTVPYNNAKAAGSFTAAAASHTHVSHVNIRATDIVIITPKNLLASQTISGVVNSAGIYVSEVKEGQFTVTHAAGAAGAIFNYFVVRRFYNNF